MNQHKLVVDKKVIDHDYRTVQHLPAERQHQYMLFYQMTRITKDRGSLGKDDRLDAVAGAVAYWVEQMSQNVDLKVKKRQEALIDYELANFIDGAMGDIPMLNALAGKPADPTKSYHLSPGSWLPSNHQR